MNPLELPSNFGNLMLAGVQEISVPAPVAWWPQAPGWKVLLMILLLLLLWVAWRALARWRSAAYRRAALRHLERIANGEDAPVALPGLLKAVALHAYPRSEVASLWGQEWLCFLDARCPTARLSGGSGVLLLRLSYQGVADVPGDPAIDALLAAARHWIQNHQVALTDV